MVGLAKARECTAGFRPFRSLPSHNLPNNNRLPLQEVASMQIHKLAIGRFTDFPPGLADLTMLATTSSNASLICRASGLPQTWQSLGHGTIYVTDVGMGVAKRCGKASTSLSNKAAFATGIQVRLPNVVLSINACNLATPSPTVPPASFPSHAEGCKERKLKTYTLAWHSAQNEHVHGMEASTPNETDANRKLPALRTVSRFAHSRKNEVILQWIGPNMIKFDGTSKG